MEKNISIEDYRKQQKEVGGAMKEGLDEREREWLEKEGEKEKEQKELLNQRKFYTDLQEKLGSGKISPQETLQWEEVPDKTEKELENMEDHEFALWVERNQFASELVEIRNTIERKAIANTIADKIEMDRKNDWQKKFDVMSDKEKSKFDRQLYEELGEKHFKESE